MPFDIVYWSEETDRIFSQLADVRRSPRLRAARHPPHRAAHTHRPQAARPEGLRRQGALPVQPGTGVARDSPGSAGGSGPGIRPQRSGPRDQAQGSGQESDRGRGIRGVTLRLTRFVWRERPPRAASGCPAHRRSPAAPHPTGSSPRRRRRIPARCPAACSTSARWPGRGCSSSTPSPSRTAPRKANGLSTWVAGRGPLLVDGTRLPRFRRSEHDDGNATRPQAPAPSPRPRLPQVPGGARILGRPRYSGAHHRTIESSSSRRSQPHVEPYSAIMSSAS